MLSTLQTVRILTFDIMSHLKFFLISLAKLFLLWILIFDFQRLLFTIHHLDGFREAGFSNWLLTFVFSFRLDISTAAYLSALPAIFLLLRSFWNTRWMHRLFVGTIFFEMILLSLIHPGEINAYTEWGHKLTSRVFMHLSNPDEVFRTADYSMTFWFVIYAILEFMFGWRMIRWLFKRPEKKTSTKWFIAFPVVLISLPLMLGGMFIVARGGTQPIPLNIDSAYFSNDPMVNDLSVNSLYFFGSSFIAYNQSDIDGWIPPMELSEAQALMDEMFDYPREHDNYFLENKRPNVVIIIMESWAGQAMSCLTGDKGATPGFDKLAKDGLLFTNIYATAGTSEIGNTSIFSGQPGIPEVSISIYPEKHRKIPSLNQDLKKWGYSSGYIFSGDLKYGNIGGYFMDHGFEDVKDENDFPSGLPRGKLNYYDQDLYKILLKRIGAAKQPFLQCAFTGSTHSPFDHPPGKNQTWTGEFGDFMNSLVYADSCLAKFMKECKKQPWYKNTLFIFVADHSHTSPRADYVLKTAHFHIPLLFYGEPIKKEYRGERIDKLGSQTDIVATLLYQMGGDWTKYRRSKDLMNPSVPEFAFHTAIRGFGWETPKGGFVYQMDMKQYIENSIPEEDQEEEWRRAKAYLHTVYQEYKDL